MNRGYKTMSRWIILFFLSILHCQSPEVSVNSTDSMKKSESRAIELPVPEPTPILSREDALKETALLFKKSQNNKNHFIQSNGVHFTNDRAVLELSSFSEIIGKNKIEYSLNQSPYEEYTIPIALTTPGKNSIKFKSIDRLGNVEESKSVQVYVDKNPPTLLAWIYGTTLKRNDIQYYNAQSYLKVEPSDTESGVKDVYVNINNEGFLPLSFLPATFSEPKFYSIQVIAMDNVLQKSNEFTAKFVVDTEPPVVSIKVSHTNKNKDKLVCSSRSVVNISSTDLGSGQKLIFYRTNGQENWISYADEFKVPPITGFYSIEFKGTDQVGNESPVQTFQCQIDKEPPKTKLEITK
jgi:large repetitive protein